MQESQVIRVALAGNPNSGKTSLFNALTGASQHVGNYAGVTVEKREGSYRVNGHRFEVQDLPGTYSLSSYSPEERITQDELLEGELDVVAAVVDSTTLKRSLVLLTQLMQVGANPVLCLNMADEAEKSGQRLDLKLLEQLLGFPVVETVGHRGLGVEELKRVIGKAAVSPSRGRLVLGERMDRALEAIKAHLRGDPADATWIATKLLQGQAQGLLHGAETEVITEEAIAEAARQRQQIEAETKMDITLFITDRYYGYVDGLLREVTRREPRADARAVSDRIDSVLAHRVLGLPFFLLVMYGIFWITFTLGEYPMGWIESGFAALGAWVSGLWPAGAASPLKSLLVDGVIGGVGGVVIFVPNIVLLFLCLALIEDTGYMARAAFIMDRLMHRFGLHGRSFIPMMTGFGCSIPGIMATRTMENERDRLTTMLVLPLMSCGARMTIWMLLIPALFPASWRTPMLFTIYLVGIVLALLLALLLRKSILKGEETPFVMELPPYRVPTVRAIVQRMGERSWVYLRKAGTIILAISVLMWVATTYPKKESHEIDAAIAAGKVKVVQVAGKADDAATARALGAARRAAPAGVEVITRAQAEQRRSGEDLRHSVAGRVGQTLEPVIAPLGFDWKIGTAMIGAFAAKEVFVAQMGIIYSLGEADEEDSRLHDALRRDYSPLVGFSLMLFLLIATPCMATIAITRRESGSWKWPLLQMGGLTVIAYLASLIFYQLGRLFVG